MRNRMKQAMEKVVTDFKKYKWLIAVFAFYYFLMKILFHAFCPLVIVTGFPCPGCGMTRAFFYFLTGQFMRGWNLNPLALLWILWVLWFLYRRYWCLKPVIACKETAMAILLCMVILYGYRMWTRFPSYAPIVYTRNSIISNLFADYETVLRRLHIL